MYWTLIPENIVHNRFHKENMTKLVSLNYAQNQSTLDSQPMTVWLSPRTKNMLCLNLIPFPSEVILDSDEDNDEVVIIFMGRVSK